MQRLVHQLDSILGERKGRQLCVSTRMFGVAFQWDTDARYIGYKNMATREQGVAIGKAGGKLAFRTADDLF